CFQAADCIRDPLVTGVQTCALPICNGVGEYLAWITGESRLVWWELRQGEYQEIPPDADGLLKSRAFPGLWLDAAALLRGDMKARSEARRVGQGSATSGTRTVDR